LPAKPNLEKNYIYSNKFFHNFHLSESSFTSGKLASSTTKTGRHDIAEILLKVALKHQKKQKIKSNLMFIEEK
jgi:hypothetical protein